MGFEWRSVLTSISMEAVPSLTSTSRNPRVFMMGKGKLNGDLSVGVTVPVRILFKKSRLLTRAVGGFIAPPKSCLATMLHLCEPAIHKQLRSRDVTAIVGCKKHHGLRNLIGRTESAERN